MTKFGKPLFDQDNVKVRKHSVFYFTPFKEFYLANI